MSHMKLKMSNTITDKIGKSSRRNPNKGGICEQRYNKDSEGAALKNQ